MYSTSDDEIGLICGSVGQAGGLHHTAEHTESKNIATHVQGYVVLSG